MTNWYQSRRADGAVPRRTGSTGADQGRWKHGPAQMPGGLGQRCRQRREAPARRLGPCRPTRESTSRAEGQVCPISSRLSPASTGVSVPRTGDRAL